MQIIGLLVALSMSQAAAPVASGRITAEGTNAPLAGARVIMMPAGPRFGPMGPPPQALTDQDGRYVFERLEPGDYRVDVQKTGYAPPDPTGGRTIQVAAGQSIAGLDFQLQKGGVIAGRLLDPSGEPLPDARIMALRRVSLPGPSARLIGTAGPGSQTNDLGEFRLSGLAPGDYYVAAMARGASPFGGPGATPPARNARTTITTTFYPGTTDQAAALPIVVAAGAEAGNISFAMQSAPAFRISGVVVDENSSPVAGAMVMLMSDPRSGLFMGPGGGAQSQADGRFVIGEVPAGSYRVTASIPIRMNNPGSSGGFVTWSTGSVVSSGSLSGDVVTGGSGGGGGSTLGTVNEPSAVVVTDANVSGVRVVVRRPPARQ